MSVKTVSCNNIIEAEAFRAALQEAGIKSLTYDETNSKVARGILDQAMEVLVNEEDYDQAMKVYQYFKEKQDHILPWCPKCGSEDVCLAAKKHPTARNLPRILATILMFIPFGVTKTRKFVCNKCGYKWER